MFLEKLCGKVISRFFPTSFETLRPALALFANNGGKNESGVHIWADTCRHVMEPDGDALSVDGFICEASCFLFPAR